MDRVLLDTNVLRKMAWNDRSQISEDVVAQMVDLGRRRLLWCSSLTISELARRLSEDEPNFDKFREAFLWMDRLGAQTTDLYEDVLVGALTRSGRRSPRAKLDQLNQLRRMVAESTSPQDLRAHGFDAKEVFAYIERVQAGYARWGARVTEHGQALRRGDFDTQPGDDTPVERARKISTAIPLGVTPGVLEMCRSVAFDGSARPVGLLPDEEAARNLRELVHWHIGTVTVATFTSYNWAKHATDSMDQWLLVYCGGGFTVATSDRRLVARVRDAGCPQPVRVMMLEDALRGVR